MNAERVSLYTIIITLSIVVTVLAVLLAITITAATDCNIDSEFAPPFIHGDSITTTALTGRLVRVTDDEYTESRQGWDKLFDNYPQVIVYCQDATDVVNALIHARQQKVAFRIRSGGHCLEGWNSIDGGICIDVSNMKNLSIDENTMTATVGTGVHQGELVLALGAKGYWFPTGEYASIGLGGVILGGGIGILSPYMGLACDNLLSADIVVASGDRSAMIVRASRVENPDLLWACRGGGGGNFGITTAYTVQIYKMPLAVNIWSVHYPFSSFVEAFSAWQQWLPVSIQHLGCTFLIKNTVDGLDIDGIYMGEPSELQCLVVNLLTAPGAVFMSKVYSWPQYYKENNIAMVYLPYMKFSPMWANEPLAVDVLQRIVEKMITAPSTGCGFWFLGWGGVARTVPSGGSAFPHRMALFYAEPGAEWTDRQTSGAHLTWVAECRDIMKPYSTGGYVNVPDRSLLDWGVAYYGLNFPRLQAIKKRYDPQNVFTFEQSIPLS